MQTYTGAILIVDPDSGDDADGRELNRGDVQWCNLKRGFFAQPRSGAMIPDVLAK